jgi:hypothetical protein
MANEYQCTTIPETKIYDFRESLKVFRAAKEQRRAIAVQNNARVIPINYFISVKKKKKNKSNRFCFQFSTKWKMSVRIMAQYIILCYIVLADRYIISRCPCLYIIVFSSHWVLPFKLHPKGTSIGFYRVMGQKYKCNFFFYAINNYDRDRRISRSLGRMTRRQIEIPVFFPPLKNCLGLTYFFLLSSLSLLKLLHI